MRRRRVLAIGLDGLEITFAERLMAAGEMPALAELGRRAARFRLDHGGAERTGLAWEHFASGLSPEAARRWAAVEFDPATYQAWQDGARLDPWWARVDRRVIVFDTPYVDLQRAPKTRGVVAWGAHDPGTLMGARPDGLLDDFLRRFGPYPSHWTYGTPWPSPARTREMGETLSAALDTRARAAEWLAVERFTDWDLFFAVVGELHGTTEGLWHGIDPDHPLHTHPSAPAAAHGLIELHRALDRMVGRLVRVAGDAVVIAFTMNGMGPNLSDAQSMTLLPELLYRHAFGLSLLTPPAAWTAAPREVPVLDDTDSWDASSATWVPMSPAEPPAGGLETLRAFVRRRPALRAFVRRARAALAPPTPTWQPTPADLEWQPAQRYRHHWPRMRAFALPSYYDGRIRINVRGRERDGMVEPARYEATCLEVERLLRECRNPRTGQPAVEAIERPATRDPFALTSSESDLLVVWRDVATALEHPRLGLIGPVALRRTGGHTGPHGMAYVAGPGVVAGDRGVRSSFDVAPTLVELLGCAPVAGMSGASLLAQERVPASRAG